MLSLKVVITYNTIAFFSTIFYIRSRGYIYANSKNDGTVFIKLSLNVKITIQNLRYAIAFIHATV